MIKHLRQGVRWLFTREALDADINKEVEFHLASEIEHRIASGTPAEEARRTALRDFGGVVMTREQVRDARGMTFWDSLSQDVRFGLRTLRRSPAYTMTAVITLGLGIGANAAMFSVIDGVLLKPLPFRQSGELVLLKESAPASNAPNVGVAIPELFEYRQRLHAITDLVEHHSMSFVLLDQGEPDRVDTGVVSANFFEMLGVKPALGRTFAPADDTLGAPAVLVLSHEYWLRKFGGDPNVIGRILRMNDRPHTIVGVLPEFPQYPRNEDVYMSTSACPFRAAQEEKPTQGFRSFGGLRVFGRLAPGATLARATTEAATIASAFALAHPNDYRQLKGMTATTASLEDTLVVGARPMLFALAATTLLVLIITCANVASLSVARTLQQSRELAVRGALGAGRARLVRQLLTESLMVAIGGGLVGLFFAWMSLDVLVSFVGRFTARTDQIGMNGAVLLFTLVVSLVTGAVFGVAPALAARRNPAQSMREGNDRSGDGRVRQRLRGALVIAQVAVSFALLVGAALLLQSFHRLASVSLGFNTDHVMTASLATGFNVPPAQADRDNRAILERLRAAPGVRAAAMTSAVPLVRLAPTPRPTEIDGRADERGAARLASVNIASDDYFATLQVPILTGREFRQSDSADAPAVAIINASMAKFWNGANPVGSRIRPAGSTKETDWITVVGVTADSYLYGGDQDVLAEYYIPYQQAGGFGGGRIIARTDGNPGELVRTIKDAVHAVDHTIAVRDLKTTAELKDGRLAAPRLTATLLAVFAGVALIITLAGITGIIATSVSQRTREFGLRMALGASRASVLTLVLGQAVRVIAGGVLVGALAAAMFSQTLRQFLFATAPTEPGVYLVVAALFLVVGILACAIPARRATIINPLRALRQD